LYLFHEIHCDDLLLEKQGDRETWEGTRRLMESLISTAEANGVKLALRFRHPFVEGCLKWGGADNPLIDWETRGHEIGTHAHTRKIRRTAVALRQAGVAQNHCVVPGLIKKNRADVVRTIAATRGLGFRYCTDQPQIGSFPYSGFVPWRPSTDLRTTGDDELLMIDVSVNPFDWGLLVTDGDTVSHRFGLRATEFSKLTGLLLRQLELPNPHPVTYFGYPFHEHNHQMSDGDQTPNEASIAAWGEFLAGTNKLGVVQALPREIHLEYVESEAAHIDLSTVSLPDRLIGELDRMDLRHDIPSWLRERPSAVRLNRTKQRATSTISRLKRAVTAPARRSYLMRGENRSIVIGSRKVSIRRFGPKEAKCAVCVSVSGLVGGTKVGLEPFGLHISELTERGLSVWLWDRSGTNGTAMPMEPGQRRHAKEAAALFSLARADSDAVCWLTFSAGNIAPLMSLQSQSSPQPKFFIDVEGPADRLSIRRRVVDNGASSQTAEREYGASPTHEHPWEPYRLICALKGTYYRFQGAVDHMHMNCSLHSEVMMQAANSDALFNNRGGDEPRRDLQGLIRDHGKEILAAIESGFNDQN
jgi:hypothetical protein